MEITQSQIVAALMAGRASKMSTELCLTLTGVTEPELALELWGGKPTKQHFIGYLVIKLCNVTDECGSTAGNYLLDQVLPASSQPLCLVASLSGALWNLRAASSAIEQRSLFLSEGGHFEESSAQSSHGECLREA